MRRLAARAVAILAAGASVAALGAVAWGADDPAGPARATAALRDVAGTLVGKVELRPLAGAAVEVRVRARGLAPGFHGFHVHQRGLCEPVSTGADGSTGAFLSAGGHLARTDERHGGHAGDLPPLRAGRDGTARATVATDAFTMDELVADDGSAFMIHAGPDNLGNIPERYAPGVGPDEETLRTGDSGARVACGPVEAVDPVPGLPASYAIPGDGVFPEGIAVDRRRGVFYVSSTSDGTIFRGSLRRPELEPFLPGGRDGRTAAFGLALDPVRGRLFVAGGATGRIFAYDTRKGELIRRFDTGAGGFVNDVAVGRDGTAYATDSFRPQLFRIGPGELRAPGRRALALEPFLPLRAPLAYRDGFNANGLVVAPGGKVLLVVQSNTGRLFRVDLATRRIQAVGLGGASLPNADGLVLSGSTLYAVRNAGEAIAKVRLSAGLRRGTVVSTVHDPSFAFPTTADVAGGRLLVVNSQFDARMTEPGPSLPFTVSAIPRP